MQGGSHSFQPEIVTVCTQCHGNVTLDTLGPPDFAVQHDWDSTPETKSKAEVAVFAERLYAAIQAYCTANAPTGVAYSEAAYPYWFKDTNPPNGTVDAAEQTSANAMKFDSKALRAAYNYQFYKKEPGAWAHNNAYIIQLLYDSIEDLGGNIAGPPMLVRPPA
jgi:hypothetical protein